MYSRYVVTSLSMDDLAVLFSITQARILYDLTVHLNAILGLEQRLMIGKPFASDGCDGWTRRPGAASEERIANPTISDKGCAGMRGSRSLKPRIWLLDGRGNKLQDPRGL
jgi:hypothetical protein